MGDAALGSEVSLCLHAALCLLRAADIDEDVCQRRSAAACSASAHISTLTFDRKQDASLKSANVTCSVTAG